MFMRAFDLFPVTNQIIIFSFALDTAEFVFYSLYCNFSFYY